MHPNPIIHTPTGQSIFYLGPPISEGIKPTVIYFALSAEATLFQDPFNQPALEWAREGIRVFSWDLPFHGKSLDTQAAMFQWAVQFAQNSAFISNFIEECQNNLQFLKNENLIDSTRLAVAGLSRGGFMATHFAARQPDIGLVLGFAPLTQPESLEEFNTGSAQNYRSVELVNLVDQLTYTPLRFYIGNHDIRVKTDACFAFIKELTDRSFSKGVRSPQSELIIYPSIGHKGHGTPPEIFTDGAVWLKNRLLNRVSS